MNDPLELQTAVDFVLESEKHIDAAARMAKVFPVVQRKIVTLVLDELEKKLSPNFGADWEIYNPRDEIFVANYPQFTVGRTSWGDNYVSLENQMREGSTVVGIWREKRPVNMALDNALADAFAKSGFSSQRNRWWAWYKVLPSEYGDWNAAPALAAMHFRREEVVEFFASEILRVHHIATPIIETFVSGT